MVLLLGCLAIGWFFYRETYASGEVFRMLSTGSDYAPALREEFLRDSWWANYLKHPVMASTWIFIGSTGTYFAVRQSVLYAQTLIVAFLVRNKIESNLVGDFQSRKAGWQPVLSLLNISIAGAVNFAVSLSAVIFNLRSPEPGGQRNIIIFVVAVIGITVNVLVLAGAVLMIRYVRGRQIARAKEELVKAAKDAQGRPDSSPQEMYLIRLYGNYLTELSKFPSRPGPKVWVSVLPITLTALRLATELGNLL